MDTKKLIGTIVGVIAFAALIAGATFAYLTLTVNVTNGVYNAKSMHFLVDYTKGTDISAMPAVNPSPSTSNTTVLTVQAGLASGSTPGTMTIYLNTTAASNTYITGGYLNYSWCEGTCSGTDFNDHKGAVSATGRTTIATGITLSSTVKDYNIYFWTDSTKNYASISGLSYAGYIEAVATQTE